MKKSVFFVLTVLKILKKNKYKQKGQKQMKIKLFKHEVISEGFYSNGIAKSRRENNEELEVRVNEFMADKKVSSVQAYGDNIMVTYEEVSNG